MAKSGHADAQAGLQDHLSEREDLRWHGPHRDAAVHGQSERPQQIAADLGLEPHRFDLTLRRNPVGIRNGDRRRGPGHGSEDDFAVRR
jgi:hypothetical protein